MNHLIYMAANQAGIDIIAGMLRILEKMLLPACRVQ